MAVAAVLDQAAAGLASAALTEEVAQLAIAMSASQGYLDGRNLAEAFAWLRPTDLIWNYWVNNYLAGLDPAQVRCPVLERRHHADGGRAAQGLRRDGPAQRTRRQVGRQCWAPASTV